MKHIFTYKKLFESKINDNILDLLDDTFIDWIDNKELFKNSRLEIAGYTSALGDNPVHSWPRVDDYVVYTYQIELKDKFDVDDIIPKINFLNKTGFFVISYFCESSNSVENGEKTYSGFAKILFAHTKIKYKLPDEVSNYLSGFKKLGFRELQSMGNRWELEKMVNVETEKVTDPKWFKADGWVRSGFGGKTYALFSEDYEKTLEDQIKILFDEIPDLSKDNKIKKYGGGDVHIEKESDDLYVEIRFRLKVRKNKPPYVYMGVFLKNNIV
jgi:hypothetical protein